MELKTLKDIYTRHDLKVEAIKWLKELDMGDGYEFYTPSEDEDAASFLTEGHDDAVIQWIKHFFNITEDDLKL